MFTSTSVARGGAGASQPAASGGTHAQWSSRMGFVLAATGSAVGLGNIWKFPYMVGQSGGAAFVLVLVTLLLTAPLVASGEMLLVLLDIRKRSVRIERRLKRRRPRQADRGLVNRLRPR